MKHKQAKQPLANHSSGIAGLYDPKWIFVAICYIAAIALMGQDPWYVTNNLHITRVFLSGFSPFLL